jgi:hypothetical protein
MHDPPPDPGLLKPGGTILFLPLENHDNYHWIQVMCALSSACIDHSAEGWMIHFTLAWNFHPDRIALSLYWEVDIYSYRHIKLHQRTRGVRDVFTFLLIKTLCKEHYRSPSCMYIRIE